MKYSHFYTGVGETGYRNHLFADHCPVIVNGNYDDIYLYLYRYMHEGDIYYNSESDKDFSYSEIMAAIERQNQFSGLLHIEAHRD